MPKKSHGHSCGGKKTRTMISWMNAKARCFRKTDRKYPAYGGRGITMCTEWANEFSIFLRDMGECPDGLTLDRINNDGNYQPGNCRWATPLEQTRNRRVTLSVEIDGIKMPIQEAIIILQSPVCYRTVQSRLLLGWDVQKALSTPPDPRKQSRHTRNAA